MRRKHNPLRFENLEDRMMLSVNVGVGGGTVYVTGDGDNDYVAIQQVDHHHLVVKDHNFVVEKIDLRQFDGKWNLNVELDGGNDHLKIVGLQHRWNSIYVGVGGELGVGDGQHSSDNDFVELRNVNATQIRIDTGAVVGDQPMFKDLSTELDEYVFAQSYYDNDRVQIHGGSTYGGDLIIRTGAEINLGLNSHPTVASATETNVDGESPHMQDNDRVYVSGFEATHGNLDIKTGTNLQADVWHDTHNDPPAGGATHVDGPTDGDNSLVVSLEDRDYVHVKHTRIHQGNLIVNTGLHANVDIDGQDELDLVDAALEGFDTPAHQIAAHIDDGDAVYLHRVKVADKSDYGRHDRRVATITEDVRGGVKVHTGANIENNDPWSYLALQLMDEDRVKLKRVHVSGPLVIWTGANSNGQIGDPTDGDGRSDKDRVELTQVQQLYGHASTDVSLGDDNDQLYIICSRFAGSAHFDGGDGANKKKVRHTYFAQPPVFENFGCLVDRD